MTAHRTAGEIAAAVARGETTASAEITQVLAGIAVGNARLGAFTDVMGQRALVRAAAADLARTRGEPAGPLAGVPFAVKNLFDIAGIATRAGSKINRDNKPAERDATAITRLEEAGAILVGACSMDEYAYGFTGENAHDGPSHNPHDTSRMSGGSSGGPAAAVAGGLVPIALGSDTNGSIRVPASLCGIYGLKPTFGRLSRAGTFPFAASLDHIGPFARNVADLAAVYDVLQGSDPRDPVCCLRDEDPVCPTLDSGIGHSRLAIADGYFLAGAMPEARAAIEGVAQALGVVGRVTLPEAHRARAAAYVITASEGGALHRERLALRAADFDPDTRDRLTAGAIIPAVWVYAAQRFRRWFHREVMNVFDGVDVILALATPITAPKLGQKTFLVDGVELGVRANLGLYAQPLSFIGLPVVTVPLRRAQGELPIGIQIVAAPWNEAAAFRVAREMEARGLALCSSQ